MKLSFARKLRFSFIGKLLFKVKWIDYLIRRFCLNKFTEDYYETTTKNWSFINDELRPILEKYKGCLGHGACLGLIRDNTIKFNQDLDYDLYQVENQDELFNDVKALGFNIVQKTYWNKQLTMFVLEKDKAYIDFFIINNNQNKYYLSTTSYEHNKNYFNQYDNDWLITTKAIIYKRWIPKIEIELINVENSLVYVPKNYNEYFIALYGYDWKTPKQYYNWVLQPKNNKVIKVKNDVEMYIVKDEIKRIFL